MNLDGVLIVTQPMTPFFLILVASCVFDFAVFAILIWLPAYHVSRKGTDRVSFGMLATSLAGAIAIVSVKSIAMMVMGIGLFGLIHLLYLDVAIVAPAVGMLLILSRYRSTPGIGKVTFGSPGTVIALLLMLLVPICLYASYVEPFNLQVETSNLDVPGMTSSPSPIKIAVLADLQFKEVTEHEHKAVDLALAANPDLILIPGDVFQGSEADYRKQEPAIKALLNKLEAPSGVFLVSGDCDRLSTLMQAIKGTAIQFIDGRMATVDVRGTRLAIAGVPINYRSPIAIDTLQRLPGTANQSDVTIVLAHRPGVALLDELPEGIDLIIAGHTHGGQIQIPGFGPPVTLSAVPRSVAAGGLSRLNNQNVYVSRGIGCERGSAPRIRFFCPPEVSILTLSSMTKQTAQNRTRSKAESDF